MRTNYIFCFSFSYWVNKKCSSIKGCVRYIFASLFLSLTRALVKLGKMFFILLEKFFSFSRKSTFKNSTFVTSSNA